ncbi:MAG: hypothetical protein AAGA81_19150, partial [Acidobacteriota bacterium]
MNATLVQVRCMRKIDQRVIAVETHQRVDIEQYSAHARHNCERLAKRPQERARKECPDQKGDCRKRQLADHSRHRNQDAPPPITQTPHTADVHIRPERRE